LTVRGVDPMPERQPLRVLLDARGRVPAIGPLFDPALASTLVLTTSAAPAASGNGVDLDEVFELLGREGVLQVLVEGGSSLTTSVLGRYADRFVAYIGPLTLSAGGIPVLADAGPATMTDADSDRY